MILGNLTAPQAYSSYLGGPVFDRAFQWLRDMPATQPDGIVELQGRAMYVNVHGYRTLARADCAFESHRRYVDLQYCISGGELIDYCLLRDLPGNQGYNEETDFIFHQPPALFSTLRMQPGDFGIFFPDDGHRPKVSDGIHPAVRKLVIKISHDLLRH